MHDLRHGFASMAVADGNSLYLVGKVLGHTQASTTQRYAHLHLIRCGQSPIEHRERLPALLEARRRR